MSAINTRDWASSVLSKSSEAWHLEMKDGFSAEAWNANCPLKRHLGYFITVAKINSPLPLTVSSDLNLSRVLRNVT